MQRTTMFTRLAIAKYLRPQATEILSAARKTQYPKTRNTAPSLQGSTIKSSDRARSPTRRANFWNGLHGAKGSELEMDVRSRLSDMSTSSQEQNGTKTYTSSNDEGEMIAETPPRRLVGVPRLKRENAFKV